VNVRGRYHGGSRGPSRRWALLICGLGLATLAGVQPVSAASYLAIDHFGRDLSNSWGQADPGGNYSLNGPAADFWVSTASYRRGLGYIRVPRPGLSRAVLLPQTQAANVEIGFTVAVTGVDADGPYHVYAVTRSAGGREVRAKVIYNRDCTISMNASMVGNGREQAIGPAVTVPNAKWCGPNNTGRSVSLRAQIVGTTVRIKAWSPVGGLPDVWQWTADSQSLPASGAVGLRVYASSSARQAATFTVYNWYARAL
jgi:hypothetical protein